MLTLLIRTDQPIAELYLYDEAKLSLKHTWHADRQLAETINLQIDDLLKMAHKTLSDLEAVGVYSGPGSFTGLRIGIGVANALSYALGLAVVGAGGRDWQAAALAKLGHGENERIVTPSYGAPARITPPRK